MENSVDLVPAMVVFLAAVHVIALVYWIYRLASDRPPQRKKIQWGNYDSSIGGLRFRSDVAFIGVFVIVKFDEFVLK